MTPAELAARFTRLPRWKYAPRMQFHVGEEPVTLGEDRATFIRRDGSAITHSGTVWPRAVLDVTDPATQGVIVAWAREVLDQPFGHPAPFPAGRWAWARGDGCAQVFHVADSEMGAVLLALEAAAGGWE